MVPLIFVSTGEDDPGCLFSRLLDFACLVRLHGAAIFGGNLKVDNFRRSSWKGTRFLFFFSVVFCGDKRVTCLLYAITKS